MSDREQGRLAEALREDWLTAIDDTLCQRPLCCTLCGSKEPTYFDVATLTTGFAVAYRLCTRCRNQDPTLTRVATILTQRYERP